MKNKELLIDNFLSEEDKTRIEAAVEVAERSTAGEIKVLIVEESFPIDIELRRAREIAVWLRAKREFCELGLDKTEEDTGILLMLSLRERIVIVKGSKAIDKQVSQATWQDICQTVVEGVISPETRADGIITAIGKIGEILSESFPIRPDDINEISNELIMKR